DDMLDGIMLLMQSDIDVPVNIGCPEYVTVKKIIDTVSGVANKKIKVKWIAVPVGVQSRNFGNEKIYSIGRKSRFSLRDGLALTYPWVAAQVSAQQNG
ncbi:MAG: hypothetical protein MIO92_09770, partial [Methanosarcinaceae archaeon]|nr:hypothetical protein [Methanosarcinaceae archaeon]